MFKNLDQIKNEFKDISKEDILERIVEEMNNSCELLKHAKIEIVPGLQGAIEGCENILNYPEELRAEKLEEKLKKQIQEDEEELGN